jgi:hypothetical protein
VSHKHQDGGPVCTARTKRDCDDRYANWQAAQQVLLAARVVAQGPVALRRFRGEDGVFAQLVNVLAGDRSTIDGEAPFTRRLRAALAEYQSQVATEQ